MDFFGLMGVLIDKPWLALIPAGLLLLLFTASRNRLALAAAGIWVLYCLYEYGMTYRLLCSGECNIRIDLLVFYPSLVLVALAGLVAALHSMWKRGGA